jgi:hypothetical protein
MLSILNATAFIDDFDGETLQLLRISSFVARLGVHSSLLLMNSHADPAIPIRVLNGVLNQVDDDLLHTELVNKHKGVRANQLLNLANDPQLKVFSLHLEYREDWLDNFRDQSAFLQLGLEHVEACQVVIEIGLDLAHHHVAGALDGFHDGFVFAADFLQHLLDALQRSQHVVSHSLSQELNCIVLSL